MLRSRARLLAAGGPAGSGGEEVRFNCANGLAVLADGTIVVTDTGNYRLWRIGRDGRVDPFAGSGSAGNLNAPRALDATFASPTPLVVRPDGGLLVGDALGVREIDPNGAVRTLVELPVGGVAVTGLAVSPEGELYLCDKLALYRFSSGGTLERLAPVHGVGCALAWHPDLGQLVVVEGERIHFVDRRGTAVRSEPSDPGDVVSDLVGGAAVDGSGRLVLADSYNGLVRREADGSWTQLFGGAGVAAVAILPDGSFVVGDLDGVHLVEVPDDGRRRPMR